MLTKSGMGLIESVIIVLFILWLAGFALHVAGGLIHILLVIAIILFAVRLVRGKS